jgi:hypothetical protein
MKPELFINFSQFHTYSGSAFLVRIRIQDRRLNADPDPQQTTLPIPVKLLYSTGNIVSNVQFVTSVVDPHHFRTLMRIQTLILI